MNETTDLFSLRPNPAKEPEPIAATQSRWHDVAADIAVRFLPPAHRPRYREEWGAALDEISDAGLPVRRAALRIIADAPAVAFALRPASVRARSTMTYLRGDRAVPQLIRFTLVGGIGYIVYGWMVLMMFEMGSLVANVVGSLVGTVIANELHRQLTFRVCDRIGWFIAQWEGCGLAMIGLGLTTAGLAGLEAVAPALSGITEVAAIIAITATVGILRFVALRMSWLPNRAESA